MTAAPYLTGQLLLAMPGMGDARFDRAAMLLCDHDEGGALAIDLAHPRPDLDLAALLRQLDLTGEGGAGKAVLRGGPVEPGRGFVLHSRDWGGEDSIDVAGLLSLTTTMDSLRAIAEGRGPRDYRVALGYAGWSPGQLEDELTRHGWLPVPATAALIFDTPPDRLWSAAFRAAGIDPALLSSETGVA